MTGGGQRTSDERAEIDEWTNQIHAGDALSLLDQLPESSIHTCVTSPPYWGLRDYGEETENLWGGDETCDHEWVEHRTPTRGGQNTDDNPPDVAGNRATQQTRLRGPEGISSAYCTKCGGWYGQLGLEPTLSQYIENIVAVGEAIQRVLRPDGSWWLNLGDTYAGGGGIAGKPDDHEDLHDDETYPDDPPAKHTRFERKTKLLVPHRVAIALEDAGWIVRSDAVWTKSNPMPSSVTDRFNETKEFVFHLTPQPDYWFDLDAIREPHADSSFERATNSYHGAKTWATDHLPGRTDTSQTHNFDAPLHPNGKNPGDVFDVAVAQCPEVHYATFPEELIDSPIKASCPPHVCAECGTPYRRETTEKPLTLDIDADSKPERPQTRRALSKARQAGLTNDHLQACRAVGFSDAGAGKVCQTGAGNNQEHVERLAAEAKNVLGGYFREFCGTRRVSTGWTSACECETDETRPGIVLDPFTGMGTTCRVAKRLGRRFIGVELNPEYVALAQENVGIDVSDPSMLTDDAQRGLAAYTDGGERQ